VRQFYNALSDCGELQAILSFYQREEHKRVTSDPLWHDCYRIAGCNLTFRIAAQAEIALHADAVRRLFSSATTSCEDDPVAPKRVCLVTGETAKIAKLHFPISGVGAKPAPLCATNEAAYWSFGKEKGFGFPVSLLHELPVFKSWQGGETKVALLSYRSLPNHLSLRGRFSDRGMQQMRGLDGLSGLNLDDSHLAIPAAALEPLVSLPHLGWLGVDAKDD